MLTWQEKNDYIQITKIHRKLWADDKGKSKEFEKIGGKHRKKLLSHLILKSDHPTEKGTGCIHHVFLTS